MCTNDAPWGSLRRPWAGIAATAALLVCPSSATAQGTDVREAVQRLPVAPIDFQAPTPERHEISGVDVLLLEDHALPLVSVYARFRGGYGLFGRDWYAAALGLPAMLRYGGTAELSPDSVDAAIDFYALQTSFGTGGGSVSAGLNTLTEHLATALGLWGALLTSPGFDRTQIELWQEREMESVRRRLDDPSSVAFSEFNKLMYGDHPVGWEMTPEDLEPGRVTPERFREIYGHIVCRENLILGVTGDVSWELARPLLERFVGGLAPCSGALPPAPEPHIRREAGVFLIERDVEQAIVVMAHPASVRLADDASYYAATIGNSILGGGGFSSRLLAKVRTEEGYAYSASSLWTMPRRHDGLVGALTSTRPETAIRAIRLILDTMRELTTAPPLQSEIRTAVDAVVNGFVFNFQEPGQIISRTMFYVAEDMPEDWLERYLAGIQRVEPSDVRRVFADQLRPQDMTILVVGDPVRIGRDDLATLGPVTLIELN